MHRRVLTSIVGVAALAVALFAAPLGYVLAVSYHNEAVTGLQREATRVAATVSDSFGTDESQLSLPADLPASLTVGVYRTDGARIAAGGPQRSAVAAAVSDGHLHSGVEGDQIAVAAPVPSDGRVTLAVRVSQPYADLRLRTLRGWTLMAGLAAIVVGLAALLARWQARQIARPLQRLTRDARALGDGDFTIRASRSGIDEADAAGIALEATAQRLGALLQRERAFSADVSHQLRTPLTSLLLALESALSHPHADAPQLRDAAGRALRRAEQLRDTVEDLRQLARGTPPTSGPLDLTELLDGLQERWHATFAAHGRRLLLPTAPPTPDVAASAPAIRQILDILLDNALAHGTGTTAVAVVDAGTAVSIEVSDEGPGLPDDPEQAFVRRTDGSGHGIGLPLARALAEAEGGRLVVRRAAPQPILSLLLPLPAAPHTGSPARAAS